jgi:1,4-dihydroxy-2-naphthoate polyprenyltransferase
MTESRVVPLTQSKWSLWLAGARPRTLPAAVVPVLVGAACAVGGNAASGTLTWWRLVLAAIVSLSLQIGVNYANDYSDGVKGTDTQRVGPMRLVGSGTFSASSVKRAAFVALGVAAVAGLVLALVTSLWLLLVGAAALVAAWFYTGGPRPYGYMGLGEVFVFVFFGVVATVGSTFSVTETLPAVSWVASLAVGCFACALLVVNNLRDIPGDTVSGKRTLAVRLGDEKTRSLFNVLFVAAAAFVIASSLITGPWSLLGLIGVAAAAPACRQVHRGATGRDLVAVLQAVGRAQLVLAIAYAAGLALSLAH